MNRVALTIPTAHPPTAAQAVTHHPTRAAGGGARGISSAAADVQLQPFTLWVTLGLVQRLHSFLAAFPSAAEAGGGAAAGPQPQASAAWRGSQGPPAAAAAAHTQQRSAAERMLDDILSGLQDSSRASVQAGQAGAGSFLAGAELKASVAVAHVCVVLALPDAAAAAVAAAAAAPGAAAAAKQLLLGQRYAVVDLFSDMPAQQQQQLAPQQEAGRGGLWGRLTGPPTAASVVGGGGGGGARALLSCSRAQAAQELTAAAGGEPIQVEVALSRLRTYVLADPPHMQSSSAQGAGVGSSQGGPAEQRRRHHHQQQQHQQQRLVTKLQASCILDASPGSRRPAGAAAPKAAAGSGAAAAAAAGSGGGGGAAAGASQPGSGAGIGPDDVPYGAAVFVEVCLDGSASPEPGVLAAVAALVSQHAQVGGLGAAVMGSRPVSLQVLDGAYRLVGRACRVSVAGVLQPTLQPAFHPRCLQDRWAEPGRWQGLRSRFLKPCATPRACRTAGPSPMPSAGRTPPALAPWTCSSAAAGAAPSLCTSGRPTWRPPSAAQTCWPWRRPQQPPQPS